MVSGEKRNCEGENMLEKATAILLDIEGTTTSISFVKDVLFPYVRDNLKDYIDSHWNDEKFKANLKALKAQAEKDAEEKLENFCPIEEGENEKESLVKNVLWQMDLDKKNTALKQLQGHVWSEGYENGKIKGQVYSDVPPMLKTWCEAGRKLYIYSSGSVEAQKLLFKNSDAGDLESFLTGHFDTEVGPKTEASSYANIAKAVGVDCSNILFLTDSVKEAVAADKAGLQTTLVIREGNAPLTDDEKKAFTTIESFKDLVFESSSKKKKICEEEQEVANVENETEASKVKNGDGEKTEVESTEGKENGEEKTGEKNETETEVKVEEKIDAETENVNSTTESGEDKETDDSSDKASKETNGDVVNGHNKNEVDEASTKNEVSEEEVNGSETNGKTEETETVPVKKVTSEEQVDSTVEVNA
ncbi:hypothetical protein RUM44_000876 [Polyplax serrata]|uniref:Enolase-phosphatase E1 n=1 Tax=Polyplax serrata TaxID=468196 RepID=A0ABR1B996_POLSC